MRILLVGAGGVGDAIAKIAARRTFFETIVVSDYDPARAERTIAWIETKHGPQGGRFVAAQIDASDPDSVAAVAREHSVTHVMNAVEPKFVPTIFAGALSPIVGLFGIHSAVPMGIFMMAAALVAVLALWFIVRPRQVPALVR